MLQLSLHLHFRKPFNMTAEEKRDILELLGPSRLLAETKTDFISLVEYRAYDTNRFSKLDENRTDSIFADMDELVRQITYDWYGLEELTAKYRETSSFYQAYLYRNTFWTREKIMTFVKSIYYSHTLTGEKKIDRLICRVYEPEYDKLLSEDIDIPMLVMMILGMLPYTADWKVKIHDFRESFRETKSFLEEFIKVSDLFDSIEVFQNFKKIGLKKNERNLLGLWTLINQVLHIINNSVNITRAGDEYKIYDVPGYWVGDNKERVYEFVLCGPTYNFTIYNINDKGQPYTYLNCCAWFVYDENRHTPVLHIMHPEASYHFAIGEKVSTDDIATFLISMDRYGFKDDDHPMELSIEQDSIENRIGFCETHLRRVIGKEAERLSTEIEHTKKINLYEEYDARYSPDTGIYAITREHILIYDASIPSSFYCIPKSLDERLDAVRIDDMCGVMKVGHSFPWIGFESMGLYFSIETDEKMKKKGVTLIPDDTPLKEIP